MSMVALFCRTIRVIQDPLRQSSLSSEEPKRSTGNSFFTARQRFSSANSLNSFLAGLLQNKGVRLCRDQQWGCQANWFSARARKFQAPWRWPTWFPRNWVFKRMNNSLLILLRVSKWSMDFLWTYDDRDAWNNISLCPRSSSGSCRSNQYYRVKSRCSRALKNKWKFREREQKPTCQHTPWWALCLAPTSIANSDIHPSLYPHSAYSRSVPLKAANIHPANQTHDVIVLKKCSTSKYETRSNPCVTWLMYRSRLSKLV